MKSKTPLGIILQVVADYYECEKIDIFEKTRKEHLIVRRQWFHYLCRILNPIVVVSSSEIGSYYSDVTGKVYDHATVLHSRRKIEESIETYSDHRELELLFILKIKKIAKVEKEPFIFKPVKKTLTHCIPTPYSSILRY